MIPADLRNEGLEIAPGYETTIYITPKQELTDDKGIMWILKALPTFFKI